MKVKNLEITDFRNFESFSLSADDEINIFCGENGVGKTNLLEAVWMLTGAKSFRHSKDKELIRFGRDSAKIKANIQSGGIEKEITLKFEGKRTAYINDKPQKSPSALSEHFNACVFSPLDLSLASDGPSVKRRFMDLCLSQLFPKYLAALKSYTRALDQRNTILRDAKYHTELIDLLDSVELTLYNSAKIITDYRARLCERFLETFGEIYKELSNDKEKVSLEYISKSGENLADELRKSRSADILVGNTSIGPHRDDLLITLDGNQTRDFSSQGQKRCAALALKLSEAAVIKNVRGEEPVLLLDDVMSELDPKRQSQLIKMLCGRQVFITCCDENNISSLKGGKVFNIKES